MEKRTFRLNADTGGLKRIVGYAAVFNTPTEMFGMREKVAPGAFSRSIRKDDIRALFNHDANFVLGRVKAGTLKLSEDDRGLFFEIFPPDTQFANDLIKSIKRGDVSQGSFGFHIEKEKWERGKIPIRTLIEVNLFDVSPVTFPAYPETSVSVRAKIQEMRTPETIIPKGRDWGMFGKKLEARIKETEKQLLAYEMESIKRYFRISEGRK